MEKHRLNKYWLIGPGVIAIILLVLALVHDFMPEIRLLMDLTPAHRAELLNMIRSNGIRDLIFMLLLVGVMNAIPGLYAFGGDALFKGNYTRLLVIVVLIVIILLLTRFVHQRRVEAATK